MKCSARLIACTVSVQISTAGTTAENTVPYMMEFRPIRRFADELKPVDALTCSTGSIV